MKSYMIFVFYDVEVKKYAENDQKYTKTKKNETFIKVIDFFFHNFAYLCKRTILLHP